MQKTQEFDASYDPIVAQSKGMLKTPELVNDSASLRDRIEQKRSYRNKDRNQELV